LADLTYTDLGVFERIRQNYNDLSPSFRKVADHILHHYRDVAFLPAAKVAVWAGVSESVVVRFAVAVGYSGYPEMLQAIQRIVKSELSPPARLEHPETDITPDLSAFEILQRVVEVESANLRSTSQEAVNQAIDGVTAAMKNARTVYCLGFRGLANLAGLLGFLLDVMGIRTEVISHGDSTLFQHLRHVEPEDVLVAFVFERYTKRTTDALKLAGDAGAVTVAITDSLTAPAAQAADYALVASSTSSSFFNSYTSAVGLINAMITALSLSDLERCKSALQELEEVLPADDFFD